jgi:hypothetical protein
MEQRGQWLVLSGLLAYTVRPEDSPMRTLTAPSLIAALAACAACSHSMIPGTKIADNPDNHAVLEVLGRYKQAAEALDMPAVLALASPAYFDRTSARGAAPVDYPGLKKELTEKFNRVKALKMEVTVKDVRVNGDHAEIDYFLVMHFSLDLPAKEKWFPESDDQRMTLARDGASWKVTSGL